jgi:hypothetical protein
LRNNFISEDIFDKQPTFVVRKRRLDKLVGKRKKVMYTIPYMKEFFLVIRIY